MSFEIYFTVSDKTIENAIIFLCFIFIFFLTYKTVKQIMTE